MKVFLIGWYGTETIGDRAILAGLIMLLTKKLGTIDLILGSLFPFFSERTIHEDNETINKIKYSTVKFSIVDTRNYKEVLKAVINSDVVVMGGGPLMDLSELYMVDYIFKLARKKRKKTAILGCGIGPLFYKRNRKLVLSILKNADITVLRDTSSKKILEEISQEFSVDVSDRSIMIGFDPAVHYTHRIKEFLKPNFDKEYISINLRRFPSEYSIDEKKIGINLGLEKFVNSLAESFPKTKILLTPMHYFHIGNDDRCFLNKIKFKLDKRNLFVQNEPLTLEETVRVYANASFNIGMRFHSVVLQTISSGKNFILDYTEPKKGKISGFIGDIDLINFYEQRYISLQEQRIDFDFSSTDEKFSVPSYLIEQSENTYLTQIKKLSSKG